MGQLGQQAERLGQGAKFEGVHLKPISVSDAP